MRCVSEISSEDHLACNSVGLRRQVVAKCAYSAVRDVRKARAEEIRLHDAAVLRERTDKLAQRAEEKLARASHTSLGLTRRRSSGNLSREQSDELCADEEATANKTISNEFEETTDEVVPRATSMEDKSGSDSVSKPSPRRKLRQLPNPASKVQQTPNPPNSFTRKKVTNQAPLFYCTKSPRRESGRATSPASSNVEPGRFRKLIQRESAAPTPLQLETPVGVSMRIASPEFAVSSISPAAPRRWTDDGCSFVSAMSTPVSDMQMCWLAGSTPRAKRATFQRASRWTDDGSAKDPSRLMMKNEPVSNGLCAAGATVPTGTFPPVLQDDGSVDASCVSGPSFATLRSKADTRAGSVASSVRSSFAIGYSSSISPTPYIRRPMTPYAAAAAAVSAHIAAASESVAPLQAGCSSTATSHPASSRAKVSETVRPIATSFSPSRVMYARFRGGSSVEMNAQCRPQSPGATLLSDALSSRPASPVQIRTPRSCSPNRMNPPTSPQNCTPGAGLLSPLVQMLSQNVTESDLVVLSSSRDSPVAPCL